MGTSIPNKEKEMQATGAGPVSSYKMTDEELEDLRARTGYKPPTNQEGEKIKQPVQDRSNRPESDEHSQQAKAKRSATEPDKEAVLRRIAKAESISSIERDLGMATSGLHYWIKKWGLTGITAVKARDLLRNSPVTDSPAVKETVKPKASDSDPMPTEVERLREELLKSLAVRNQLQDDVERLTADKAKVVALSGAAAEKQAEVLATFHKANIDLDEERQQLLHSINALELDLAQHQQSNAELLEERLQLLQTIEQAAVEIPPQGNDSINHPAHYNAGTVECIDAIEAATTGLVGIQAYNTGAAIKYLWRWTRKGGLEDLRKARWYINRLLGEAVGH